MSLRPKSKRFYDKHSRKYIKKTEMQPLVANSLTQVAGHRFVQDVIILSGEDTGKRPASPEERMRPTATVLAKTLSVIAPHLSAAPVGCKIAFPIKGGIK